MKKLLALVLSLLLLCSFGLFAACDNDGPAGPGSITGEFTVATDDDCAAFMTAITDVDKLFPGMETSFGFSAEATASVSATVGSGEEAMEISLEIKKLSVAFFTKPGTGTESLYTEIVESAAGTVDDPIPYDNNMELEQGKYYSQDGEVYLCTRGTGIPVYNQLADLVGIYVELID